MTKQIREILIRADVKGTPDLKNMAKEFGKINGSVKETTNVLKTFRNAFFALQGLSFAGFGIRELTQSMDSYQKLSDRIKVFTGSQTEANSVMDGLARVADKTRSSIEGVATVYSRLALSLNESKLTSGDLLFVTEQLQNSFRLSGATAAEATGATIQLSQGLASGTLRGQELRSVLESNALIGAMLAKELNTTRGQLMKMAEAGKITSKVFLGALANGATKLNEDAKVLGTTFQEATDRGLNKFNVALGKFNREMGLSAKYDTVIQSLVGNLTLVGIAMGAVASLAIPSLIVGLAKLKVAFITFAASNPLLLLFTLISSGIAFAYLETEKFEEMILKFRVSAVTAFADVGMGLLEIVRLTALAASMGKENFVSKMATDGINDLAKLKESALRDYKEIDRAAKTIAKGNEALDMIGTKSFEEALKSFKKGIASTGKESEAAIVSLQKQIEALNVSFTNGAIGPEVYNDKLTKLTALLYAKKGPIPLFDKLQTLEKEGLARLFTGGVIKNADEFQRKMDSLEFRQLQEKMDKNRITTLEFYQASDKLYKKQFELNAIMRDRSAKEYGDSLRLGAISLNEYNASIEELKIQGINDDFVSGKKDIYEYNKALIETSSKFQPGSSLFVGTSDYIKSAGTLSQNISSMVTETFGNLENTMVDFVKTGKFNFKDFANSVLEDLNRIIIRSMIIQPLAKGILGAMPGQTDAMGGTTSYSQDYMKQAKGGAWNSGVQFFAKGGVVDSPTMFGHKTGLGVMGEAGPEAILPLKRGSDGNLGVAAGAGGSNVVINVINNSANSSVEQKESTGPNGERNIDIIIVGKVKEAFANGSMDKTMSGTYGLNRKGY